MTNKSKKWMDQFKKIANKYGLDLDGKWNKYLLPHRGRHPNKYHEWVLKNAKKAAQQAKNDKEKFLELYEKMVKSKVLNNPELLRKSGWK